MGFFPIGLYFGGAENWIQLLVLLPLASFFLAYYIRKRANQSLKLRSKFTKKPKS
ncbi:hypothetical protein [Aneurinibacillus tyrosinisolvens]|uniref:hypothetical protein n=1 Tax=Aneurinibacillus tyrosinisolvens TaxID=1443435 RepID=UPI000A464AA7|nr:hypothetical protein [Aneurinibacillus tyrosinisolvens]